MHYQSSLTPLIPGLVNVDKLYSFLLSVAGLYSQVTEIKKHIETGQLIASSEALVKMSFFEWNSV
jgi:hypothetical protein